MERALRAKSVTIILETICYHFVQKFQDYIYAELHNYMPNRHCTTTPTTPRRGHLLHVQPENDKAVNEAVNDLYVEEEDFEGLRTSIALPESGGDGAVQEKEYVQEINGDFVFAGSTFFTYMNYRSV